LAKHCDDKPSADLKNSLEGFVRKLKLGRLDSALAPSAGLKIKIFKSMPFILKPKPKALFLLAEAIA